MTYKVTINELEDFKQIPVGSLLTVITNNNDERFIYGKNVASDLLFYLKFYNSKGDKWCWDSANFPHRKQIYMILLEYKKEYPHRIFFLLEDKIVYTSDGLTEGCFPFDVEIL